MPKTALIIPTYGQEEFTIRCFDSILKHTDDYLLVWMDNGSTEKSKQSVINSFKQHKNRLSIWSDTNLGFVKGVNNGIEILLNTPYGKDCEYFAILNNDIEVSATWLDKMTFILESDNKIGAIGPVSSAESSLQGWKRLFKSSGIQQYPNLKELDTDARGKILDSYFNTKHIEAPMGISCPMVAFFCTIFRKEIFQKVGLLDPIYGLGYGDDDDLCLRIYNNEYKIRVSLGSYVFHNHKTTFNATLSKEEIRHIKRTNRSKLEKKFKIKS